MSEEKMNTAIEVVKHLTITLGKMICVWVPVWAVMWSLIWTMTWFGMSPIISISITVALFILATFAVMSYNIVKSDQKIKESERNFKEYERKRKKENDLMTEEFDRRAKEREKDLAAIRKSK